MSEMNFEKDAAATPVSIDDLKNITSMAADVQRREHDVAVIEETLKKAKAELRKVQEHDLPEAMLACNMETFVTSDGLKVSVKETLYASIAAKNKVEAGKWLIENELGALVKEDVIVGFDGGDHEAVQELLDKLILLGTYNVTTSESMNTASIKAAIKELLADGKEVPLELFGAYFSRKAVVK